jgi:hypothetical protein
MFLFLFLFFTFIVDNNYNQLVYAYVTYNVRLRGASTGAVGVDAEPGVGGCVS